MLPDFPEVKARAMRALLGAVQKRIPEYAPILSGIKHVRVHEGCGERVIRQDQSEEYVKFEELAATIGMNQEQMRRITVEQLLKHISEIAEQLAKAQSQLLFTRVSQLAVEEGNVVSAADLGNKEAFLELQRRLRPDFDPETLKPIGQVLVLHPSQVESFLAQAKEWEKDPDFLGEMERIEQVQLEAWRARESNRKLVD